MDFNGGWYVFFLLHQFCLLSSAAVFEKNYLTHFMENISILVGPLLSYYNITALMGLSIYVQFEVGNHNSSETSKVLKLKNSKD